MIRWPRLEQLPTLWAARCASAFRAAYIRVEALGLDHCIGECINRLGWVAGDPLLIVRWQAVAKLRAQLVQQLGRVHDENGNSRIALYAAASMTLTDLRGSLEEACEPIQYE